MTHKLTRFTALAAALASVALMAAPAAGVAAPVKFGSELNPTVQPSNSQPGLACPGGVCTMILNEAYGRPDGGELAPKTGTIKRIRLIAGGPGNFQLQIAKVQRATQGSTHKAKVVYNGPKISYAGQDEASYESDNYKVESFKVNVPVKKGQQLALRGNITSMVRCSSGGNNTLLYTPLLPGDPFKPAIDTDGCWVLMEAVIK